MRRLLITLLWVFILPPAQAATEPLLVAGQLRTGAQRVAKLALQRTLNAHPGQTDHKLTQQLALARHALELLTSPGFAPARTSTLERTRRHWESLLSALTTGDPAARLEEPGLLAEQASIAAGKLAMELTQGQGLDHRAQLADLVLRQGMLAQRMARLYLLRQAGGSAGGLTVDWEQTQQEYTSASRLLEESTVVTAPMRARLKLADTQWMFFEQAMNRASRGNTPNPQDASHVATTSDRIVETMDELAHLLLTGKIPPAG